MIIGVGGDHAGFKLKKEVIIYLKEKGHKVEDFGSFDSEPVDFPDIAKELCKSVIDGKVERGIMVCGTGVGAAIASNKIQGIRAAVCHDIYSSHQCVEHDNVNVMCLGAQIIGPVVANKFIDAFLQSRFSTEEHFRRRVKKLEEMDKLR